MSETRSGLPHLLSISKNEMERRVEMVEWTPESAKQIGLSLEGSSPEAILRWGFENFAPSIVMATGFGPEGIALIHLVSQIARRPSGSIWVQTCSLLIPT